MFNRTAILVKPAKTLAEQFITNNIALQQCRTAYILHRRHPVPLHKINSAPKKLKNRQFIYELIEDTDIRKRPMLDLILLEDIAGIGEARDRVQVNWTIGYSKLLLPKKAVYASPENLIKHRVSEKKKRTYSSFLAPITVKYLSIARINILVSSTNPWTIGTMHVKVGFRRKDITVTDDAITLPELPISGPNLDLEGKEFYVTITINKQEQVKVRCVVNHIFEKEESPFPVDYWKYPAGAVHPEFDEVLDSMPKNYALMNTERPEVNYNENPEDLDY